MNGSRLLRSAEVRAFIEREQKERKKRQRMDADEALEGITRHARAAMRELFFEPGALRGSQPAVLAAVVDGSVREF